MEYISKARKNKRVIKKIRATTVREKRENKRRNADWSNSVIGTIGKKPTPDTQIQAQGKQ
jgi:hypothetical protein